MQSQNPWLQVRTTCPEKNNYISFDNFPLLCNVLVKGSISRTLCDFFQGKRYKKNQTAAVDHAAVFSRDCLQNSMTTNKEDTYASGSLGTILTESRRDARGTMCPREMQHIPPAKEWSLI